MVNKQNHSDFPTIGDVEKYIAQQAKITGSPIVTVKQVAKEFGVHKGKHKKLRNMLKSFNGKAPPTNISQEPSKPAEKPSRKKVFSASNKDIVDKQKPRPNTQQQSDNRILGIMYLTKGGAIVEPIDKKARYSYNIELKHTDNAKDGEMVEISPIKSAKRYLAKTAKVIKKFGDMNHPRAASQISIHQHEIPYIFPDEVLTQAEKSENPVLSDARVDLRDIKLITIDGADARDFDDAVFAEPDSNPDNQNGWHVLVAIADVAHYVTAGSPLDEEAIKRGNSVYFPDRVVPMLPEKLSNGLCSLVPNEDRHCLAVHLWIDEHGEKISHKFVRGIMKSHARWTYEDIQAAYDEKDAPDYVQNLYSAYLTIQKSIDKRGALNLNLPEYKIKFSDDGNVDKIEKRTSIASQKLIEAFMVSANVAAAEELTEHRKSAVFRVHETPNAAKIETLRDMLIPLGYKIPLGTQINSQLFNNILDKASQEGESAVINIAVLRSQMQAYYGSKNVGHFGLALSHYAHFTSPIRRYSDLVVHRKLIEIIEQQTKQDKNIDLEEIQQLDKIAEHISITERRAMKAERAAMDRYLASYMEDKVGAEFIAHISGISRHGIFATLDETGADGFIPNRTLKDDFYIHDEKKQQLRGKRNGLVFKLGQEIKTELADADGLTGRLRLKIID